MEILSLSEAKMKLSELIDRVQSTDAEIVITKNGRPAVVVVVGKCRGGSEQAQDHEPNREK